MAIIKADRGRTADRVYHREQGGYVPADEPVLQYRQQEKDWGGQNEEPEYVWTEWEDVHIFNIKT